MSEEKAVTTTGDTSVVRHDYGDEVGAGFEGAEEHLNIPFLTILQSNSPQVEEDGIDGAKPGMLFNTVTNELMEEAIFQPVFQEQAYVEWIPREAGGGFVGRHEKGSQVVTNALKLAKGRQFGKLSTEDDNDLVETFYAYGNLLDARGIEVEGLCVIAFKSTAIKPFRNWLTSMFTLLVGEEGKRRKPPIYAHRAKISTVGQRNKKGSFYNFRIEPFNKTWANSLVSPDSSAYVKGKDFRRAVKEGRAKPVFEGRAEETEEAPELL